MTARKDPADFDKLGRPTDYKPEYDEEIVKFVSEGMYIYEVCVKWGVSYDAVNEWSHRFPSFRRAYARAKTVQQANFMKVGMKGLHDRNFNANVFNIISTQFLKMAREREMALDFEGNTPAEKAASIIDSLKEGKMSADEFSKIMNGIATAVKIQEVTDLDERTKALEKKAGIEKK